MFLDNKNNNLDLCLKNRQSSEPCQNKGKNLGHVELSAELSTGVVDRKILVPLFVSVQPSGESGIEVV